MVGRWQSGAPLAFFPHHSSNYVIHTIDYGCFKSFKEDFSWLCNDLKERRISVIKDKHLQNLKPNKDRVCTLMVLTNLADPIWIAVPCDKRLLFLTVCLIKEDIPKQYDYNRTNGGQLFSCTPDQILFKNKCYLFLWVTQLINDKKLCKQHKEKQVTENKIKSLQPIFDAVSADTKFPIFFARSHAKYYVFEIINRYKKLIVKAYSKVILDVGAYYICQFEKMQLQVGNNIFKCKKGGYISPYYICDKLVDCPNDNSDEDFCNICHENSMNCKSLTKHKIYCGFNFYMSFDGNCKKINSFIFWKDHFSEYSISPEVDFQKNDNNIFQQLSVKGRNDSFLVSCKPFEISCGNNTIPCYNFTDICTYKLSSNNLTKPCPNGNHLKNCFLFECASMFKCKESYCVPWTYVCNGKWDCPMGDDELQNPVCIPDRVCESMYKCKGDKHVCVSTNNVCNEVADCPHGDDEFYCELKEIGCPSNCYCLIYAITCRRMSFPIFLLNINTIYISVYISDSEIPYLSRLNSKLELTYFVKLPRNNIHANCPISVFRKALLLDLSYNYLESIQQECFKVSKFLINIGINDNQIMYLEEYSFHNLKKLKFLNLSNNPLVNLPKNCFLNAHDLKVINFKDIQFQDIEYQAFIDSDISVIITDDYHVSCVAPGDTVCSYHLPWYLSCSDILPDKPLKIICISLSTFIICFNIVSILLQIYFIKDNKVFSIIVLAINFGDILCGFYLCCIWLTDNILGLKYAANEQQWRSHPICFTAFFLVLCFGLQNFFLSFFQSLTKLMVVLYPLNTKFKSFKAVLHYLSGALAFIFIASLFFTMLFNFREQVIPTSLCIPFVDPTGRVSLIKIISWLVIISQSLASVAMVTMHVIIVKTVNESKMLIGSTKYLKTPNVTLILQLFMQESF